MLKNYFVIGLRNLLKQKSYSLIKINTSEEVRVDAFGEPSTHVNGGAHVNKRLIFGRTAIYKDF